jgi:hypothetical protein
MRYKRKPKQYLDAGSEHCSQPPGIPCFDDLHQCHAQPTSLSVDHHSFVLTLARSSSTQPRNWK